MTGLIVAAIVVPLLLLLYFLRLRRLPKPIASTLLWMKSIEDLRANAPFQRLRASLLLFIQLLIIILLVLALMQPQIESSGRTGGRRVFLIDNSASMQSTDSEDSVTRLQKAKELAIGRIQELHGGGLLGGMPGEVMVIAFADGAEVMCPFTDSSRKAISAINSIRPTDGRTSIAEAMQLSRAFTTNPNPDQADRPVKEPAILELFSDGRIQDLDGEVLRAGERVIYNVIGSPEADNLGIISMAADRPYDQGDQVQVFASIANYNPDPADCTVQMSVNGTIRAVTPEPVQIPAAQVNDQGVFIPGIEQVVFLPFEQPRNAIIEVALLREDDLAVDNTCVLVTPPERSLSVVLVEGRSTVVKWVLDAMPLRSLDLISGSEFDAMVAEGELPEWDVIVLDGHVPSEIPPGHYLSIGPTPPVEGFNQYGTAEQVFVQSIKQDHPLLRAVNLDRLYVGSMNKLAPNSEIEVLAESVEGPLIMSIDRGGLRMVHVSFDLLESNWPRLRSFVNFVANALPWIATTGEAASYEGLTTADVITSRVPLAAQDVTIELPDGERESLLLTTPGSVSWGPPARTGLYTLRWSMPGSDEEMAKEFAVNLVNEPEGHVQADEELEFSVDLVQGRFGAQQIWRSLWPWLIGVAIAMLMIEWLIYNRKNRLKP